MKKLLFVLFIGGAFILATSCSKVCSCTEKVSETTVPDVDLKGQSVYKNCKDYEKALNDAAAGLDQDWVCTSK